MSFPRPTLAELVTAAEQDLSARVLDGEPLLQQSTLAALARVQAGGLHLLYGFLSWAARQVHVHNCEAEYLDALAATWGPARKAASYAAGTVTFTGADGAVVAAGAELKRADGALYTTTADATISGGAASAPVDAVEAGTGGNESAGASLTLTSPVSGVQSTAAVDAGGITGGADQEADEALRARLITRIQQPPHGGAGYDYVAWALEVSGVTRAWCYPEHMGPGTSSPARGRGLKPGPVDQIHPPGRRPPPRGRNSRNSASPFLFIAIGCCLMIIQIQKTGHRTRDNH